MNFGEGYVQKIYFNNISYIDLLFTSFFTLFTRQNLFSVQGIVAVFTQNMQIYQELFP